ncbi:hypothetical protein ABIE26_000683 [Pedobacter africanus]|uniref:Uncharacterized protein n=1 Tax=Pedobacter africanus TaxID=151894 RepID=A0ACC6KTZ4_9SPHI|nr:hypothetical protein [Pedobacter africanus]
MRGHHQAHALLPTVLSYNKLDKMKCIKDVVQIYNQIQTPRAQMWLENSAKECYWQLL